MFCEAVSLARLVKAEIVSPIYGILINTDVGNPTAPFITALGRQASFTRLVGTHSCSRPYKGIRIHLFLPTPSSSFAIPSFAHSSSSSQACTSHLNLLQQCSE